MAIFLDRIDSSPIVHSNFDMQFLQWIWVLVDTLNENMSDIQTILNLFVANGYTATEISQMESDGLLSDGIIIYDTTNNVYVGRESGALVKFTTAAWP